ncbi:MAG: class I SAM-dependent methyltransferase [Acidobacteria bacterium]|jgi:SAM-dependent methyltransferase|nr:MAG: class I SAM-dependent methyltransferase [Acidobacteriota bacterium]GIU82978.1 MAG: methyltransferase [Pyrinomonadaceae bacterium]
MIEKRLCLACGSEGKLVYKDCTDFFCGTTGVYDYLECPNCKLLWVFHQPTDEELAELYEQYYDETLMAPEVGELGRSPKDLIRELILHAYKGYPLKRVSLPKFLAKSLGLGLGLIPPVFNRSIYGLGLTFPDCVSGGKLLEIGCGRGWFLKIMKNWGWKAIGVETNPASARFGREKFGVEILEGQLEEQNFPDNSFDFIVMRHVFEHVSDPVKILEECKRILKPGGALALAMPNGKSLGSRWFGKYWRGLTPPWHLHLFNPKSLKILLEESGYQNVKVRTLSFPAHWIYTSSKKVQAGTFKQSDSPTSCWWFHFLEKGLNAFFGNLGEELEAIAYKRNS